MPKQDNELTPYLKEIGKYPLLGAKETARLVLRAQKGDRRARNRIIRSNLRLVISIAKKYVYRGVPLIDLIEEGNMGLLTAIEHFEPKKGRFSTYATWWIKRAIWRTVMESVKCIRLPCHIVEIIAKWKHTSNRLAQRLGRQPELYEVAKEINLSPVRLRFFKNALLKGISATRQLSLDLLKESGYTPYREGVKVTHQDRFSLEESEMIKKLLDSLSSREAQILIMRYGLSENQPSLTLQGIARRIRLSRERVRQIINKALNKLHSLLVVAEKE